MMFDRFYLTSECQSDSVISKSGKSFHMFFLTNLDVHLVDELFCHTGHGSEVSLNLLESTGSVLEFFRVETRSFFYVFFRGYIAKVEDQAHCRHW